MWRGFRQAVPATVSRILLAIAALSTLAVATAATAADIAAPFAGKVFCLKNPAECRVRPAGHAVGVTDSGKVVLTQTRIGELAAVNRAVNAAIRPRAEAAGSDQWQIGPAAGDCEDYALTKRHRLIAMGWPSSATLLSRVRTPRGELHVVLTVRTDRGDYVLDNLAAEVRPAGAVPYRWESTQSERDPRVWKAA
jgi:predicted transglutaminase-like cysteine proteinase